MVFSPFKKNSTLAGFTLVELLVVIAIIALLLTFITPVLQTARVHATGVVCLGNQMGLIRAYLNYANDNEDRLADGNTWGYVSWLSPPRKYAWAFGPMNASGNFIWSEPVTFEDRRRGIMAGALWEYTGKIEMYHCPSDDRFAKGTNLGYTTGYQMYRSYNIQGGLNGEETNSITKLSLIKFPSSKYVFVEEYYDGMASIYNAGSWMLGYNEAGPSWWNIMAIWHKEKYTLSFADGHAEILKCMDERTINYAEKRNRGEIQEDNPDLKFMYKGYAVPLPRQGY